jgi:hypothetical protein
MAKEAVVTAKDRAQREQLDEEEAILHRRLEDDDTRRVLRKRAQREVRRLAEEAAEQ